MHYIYELTFPNGKSYVGQTKRYKARMNAHKNDPLNPNRASKCCRVHNAILKYGWKNITHSVLETCETDIVDDRERYWIAVRSSNDSDYGYNIEGGGNKNKGHSIDTRKKISAQRFGKRTWSKEVAQIDPDTNRIVNVWDSLTTIRNIWGVSTSNISTMCNGKEKHCTQGSNHYTHKPITSHGFRWIFMNDLIEQSL